jgi:hypothetical protein
MYDDLALSLPVGEINERLTRNARERERLQTLLRIAVEAREDAEKLGAIALNAPQAVAARPEGATR